MTMIDKDKRPYLLNRMLNLKVEQAQAHIVELQALLIYLGIENLDERPDTRNVDEFLENLFIKLIGRKKSM